MLRPLFRLRPLARSSLAALAPRPLAPLRLAPVARALHVSAVRAHGSITRPPKGEGIRLIFRDAKGEEKEVRCNEGDDILGVAHEWDIELEGEHGERSARRCGEAGGTACLHLRASADTHQAHARAASPAPPATSSCHQSTTMRSRSRETTRTTCSTWPLA
jgi:hypothetical protein